MSFIGVFPDCQKNTSFRDSTHTDKKYNVYKTGGVVMKPKKDIIITFRTDEDTKKQIEKMAEEKEW